MKIRIKLISADGKIDRQTVELSEHVVLGDIYDAIGAWKDTLAPGDTIKIEEVA